MIDKEYILISVHITDDSANIQRIIGDSGRNRNFVLLHISVEIFAKREPAHFFLFGPDPVRHNRQLSNQWVRHSGERHGAFGDNPRRPVTLFGPRHSREVHSRQCQERLLEQGAGN